MNLVTLYIDCRHASGQLQTIQVRISRQMLEQPDVLTSYVNMLRRQRDIGPLAVVEPVEVAPDKYRVLDYVLVQVAGPASFFPSEA